jgi:hypothetical protein
MESILNELGAVKENESDVQGKILRDRILKSVRLPTPNGEEVTRFEPVTVIGGIPELSLQSQNAILRDLVDEVERLRGKSPQYENAVIKLRIFKGFSSITNFSITPVPIQTTSTIATAADNNAFTAALASSVSNKVKSLLEQKKMNAWNKETNDRKDRVPVNFIPVSNLTQKPSHTQSSKSTYSRQGSR